MEKDLHVARVLRVTARLCSLFVGIFLFTGCSSFNREWKSALAQPVPAGDLAGPWQGYWKSEENGHNGALRCLITRTSETEYLAHFRANYWGVFRYTYAVPLNVSTKRSGWQFQGEANLGRLAGGLFQYKGTATPTRFHATYEAKSDYGSFQMGRPGQEVPPRPGDDTEHMQLFRSR